MKADGIQTRLRKITSPWETTDDGKALTRTYELPSFRADVVFVAYVAELAEAADHRSP